MAYNKDYNIGDIFGGIGSIGSILTGLTGIITNAVQGKKQRDANIQATRETNAQNERLVDKQNAAAAAESEKQRAYESAPAQVSRLRSAGMSKAGALGAINGAGGYTPAPVNAAQAQAPTAEYQPVDFSGLANAMQGMAQLQEQKRVNTEVIKNTKQNTLKQQQETRKEELEANAQELLNSANTEVRENFPALRSFLTTFDFTPNSDNPNLVYSTDEIWKSLESKNKDLYEKSARNEEMRSYVDNYVAYKFDENMLALGYTTSYQQSKAIQQQVKEFLSEENVTTRKKQAHIDYLVTEYEEGRLTKQGFNNPFSSWTDFRLWLKSVLGSKVTQQVVDFGGKYLEYKFMPRGFKK